MKKLLFTLLISLMCFTINVNAENTVIEKGQSNYESLLSQYNKGIQKTNINGTGTVTLYGYSDCDSSGCDYKYSNTSNDFKEVLKSSVVCTGGEKYIIYQTTGGADGYKSNNTANYVGEAVWSEDFSITCTNTSSSSTVTLNNSTNNDTGNNGISNGGTANSGNEYNSSNTTDPSETGVETYYIVLGIVGLITYMIMLGVKKYNLFKKI